MSGVIFLVLCEVEDKGERCSSELVEVVVADELDMETSEEPTDCSETDAEPEQTTRVDDEVKVVVSGVPIAAEVEVGENGVEDVVKLAVEAGEVIIATTAVTEEEVASELEVTVEVEGADAVGIFC